MLWTETFNFTRKVWALTTPSMPLSQKKQPRLFRNSVAFFIDPWGHLVLYLDGDLLLFLLLANLAQHQHGQDDDQGDEEDTQHTHAHDGEGDQGGLGVEAEADLRLGLALGLGGVLGGVLGGLGGGGTSNSPMWQLCPQARRLITTAISSVISRLYNVQR